MAEFSTNMDLYFPSPFVLPRGSSEHHGNTFNSFCTWDALALTELGLVFVSSAGACAGKCCLVQWPWLRQPRPGSY